MKRIYLDESSFAVEGGNAFSKCSTTSCGPRQGSGLGRLLILVYIDVPPPPSPSNIVMHAGDVNIQGKK